MWTSGLRGICASCESVRPPRVTNELWDAVDQVVVGCALCESCGARYLFTRHLTKHEAQYPQAQGRPIQKTGRVRP